MDFEACRFDFRLDAKNGLTPSKRKKSERRGTCYNTLFKCKFCGILFETRAGLLEHKLVHNENRCPVCDLKVARTATLRDHLSVVHGIGKFPDGLVEEEEVQQENQHMQETKLALRKHIKVNRGLGKKKAARNNNHESPDAESSEVDMSVTPSMVPMPEIGGGLPVFPSSTPQSIMGANTHNTSPAKPQPPLPIQKSAPTSKSSSSQMTAEQTAKTSSTSLSTMSPSTMAPSIRAALAQGQPMISQPQTPVNMPGYVYINVPIIMAPEQKDGQQPAQQPNTLPLLPPNAIPLNPAIPFPNFFPAAPFTITPIQRLPTENLNIKKEPGVDGKSQPPVPSGMALPHLPVNPIDLEPGELHKKKQQTISHSKFGMQLPTMVRYEDLDNTQSAGLSRMISGQTDMPTNDQNEQNQPNFGESNVIDIQPRPIDERHDSSLIYEKDFPPYNSSYSAEDDSVVDLSMDHARSAALGLSHGLLPLDFADDCVLDLSKKSNKDGDPDDNQKECMKDNSRPESATSFGSDPCSLGKGNKKPKYGGLNSMVAKLWETKIKISKNNSDDASKQTEVGTIENPITLEPENSEGQLVIDEDENEIITTGNKRTFDQASDSRRTRKKKKVPTATLR